MHPTAAERHALRAAVTGVLRATDFDEDRVHAYEREVRGQLAPLLDAVPGSLPVVAYVQREDWKWIMAFVDEPIALTVIRDEVVSSRNMLLLANESARRALGLGASALAQINDDRHDP